MKKRRTLQPKRIRLVIAAVAMATLITVVWLWHSTDSKNTADLVVVTDAEPLLVSIEKGVAEKFGEDYEVRRTGWTGQRDTGEGRHVAGYDFMLSSKADPGVDIQPPLQGDTLKKPTKSIESVVVFVRQQLTANGFVSASGSAMSFRRGDTTCAIKTNADVYSVALTCNGLAIDKALAAQAAPFVKVYLRAHGRINARNLVYGPMVVRSQNPAGPISASKTEGYDLAEAVVAYPGGSSLALFYSEQGDWRYITESTDEFGFSCSAITRDPDARKAYRGQWCYQRENDQGLRILDYAKGDNCGRIACSEDGEQHR